MKRKFHVQFCNGGGAGDRSTDRNHPTAHTRRVPKLLSRGQHRSGRERRSSQPGQRVNRDVELSASRSDHVSTQVLT